MFDYNFKYASQRFPVFGRNVVCTSQPLAVSSALKTLWRGGSAMDAALAAAMTLTVVEPTMNGIGGDAFAIVWDGTGLHGLNSSGRSPSTWSHDRFASASAMPLRGWESVTVPGQVAAWVKLHERFGRLPFEALAEDACFYAIQGFHVTPLTAALWGDAPADLRAVPGFLEAFWPTGRAPKCGEVFRFPEQAQTLRDIVETKGRSFYGGRLAGLIAGDAAQNGAALTEADLDSHAVEWVNTLSIKYGSLDVHELPPNSQGLSTLIALGLFSRLNTKGMDIDSVEYVHLQIESMKLAFADANSYLADANFLPRDPRDYLDEGYLDSRVKLINQEKASLPAVGIPSGGGTVYVTVADERGMMVSFIQSNWWGFGSGVVIPRTGISLHNRANSFSLEKGHPNHVAGAKRPFHTLIPGFVMRDGKPFASFGLMGGTMQAQGHFQLVCRMEDALQNPQTASDAPRWRITKGLELMLEEGFSSKTAEGLAQRGHQIVWKQRNEFGGAQIICKTEGGYTAASDHRKDGHAAGF